MKTAAVITFPGSNCDDDIFFVLEKVCEFKVDKLWHKDTPDLSQYHLVVLPGGFSYGDYLRCGAIAALSPIMEKVKAFAAAGGLVFGTCNGFQILCEAGLLPGALARNESLKFVCKDIGLRVTSVDTPWSNQMKANQCLSLPIAHGDGRYVIDEAKYREMESQGQIVFKYLNNPNGSLFDVAGVCNQAKNVLGMMPHPERATDLRSRDGLLVWKSVIHYLEKAKA